MVRVFLAEATPQGPEAGKPMKADPFSNLTAVIRQRGGDMNETVNFQVPDP